MKKITLGFLSLMLLTLFSTAAIAADNAILASLEKQAAVQQLDDKALGEIRGTAMIVGQGFPSSYTGLTSHKVTWKGFGNKQDYRSYNYLGHSYNPGAMFKFQAAEGTFIVTGDEWHADDRSGPNTWNAYNSYLKEYHFQVLDPYNNLRPTPYGFREAAWNRPLDTLRW